MKYLKSRQYYEDRYDRHTIEYCTREEITYKMMEENYLKEKPKEIEHFPDGGITEYFMQFIKGERYLDRRQTIKEWMQKDIERDNIYENTPEPKNTYCDICRLELELMDRELINEFNDKPTEVKFIYKCQPCKRAFNL